MRFGGIGVKRPEDFPKTFNVYSVKSSKSERARVMEESRTLKKQLECILSVATHDEQFRYHQINVAVSHRIMQNGPPQAEVGNYFALVEKGEETRFFRVQSVHDKGSMGIVTTYYCEERSDM